MKSSRSSLLGAALVALALGAVSASACGPEGRFPVCKTNADCSERETGTESPICYNLRCVQCRYDTDCKTGNFCDTHQECRAISGAAPTAEPESPSAFGPTSFEDCVKGCEAKDQKCATDCQQRFPKKEPTK
jgi:Cys-rich repeat protein